MHAFAPVRLPRGLVRGYSTAASSAVAQLILDPDISEIIVNGSRRVFVERKGLLKELSDVSLDERNLCVAVKNIARARR